jgi:hypothetical protein
MQLSFQVAAWPKLIQKDTCLFFVCSGLFLFLIDCLSYCRQLVQNIMIETCLTEVQVFALKYASVLS